MTTFTRERLQEVIDGDILFTDEQRELARIALAAMQQEPEYWLSVHGFQPYLKFTKADAERDVAENGGLHIVPLYTAPPAPVVPDYPEALPCPVLLEPGLRFGKGVQTSTMLGALQRRAEYYAELEAMTPEQRADHDTGMKELVAMLPAGNSPVITEEKGSSLQLRNLIRKRHAEWSEATFGNVGPIGSLKHLSKEALEAAADVDDLSEWADMQFLLWDAQRRAGISDGEITAAMEEKLKVNMARQWPEPKDGEPRLHIKATPQQEVK